MSGNSGDSIIPGAINGTGVGETLNGQANVNDIVVGLGGNDLINGNSGDDYLLGGSGADTLNGEAGADTLDGGAGADSISGGAGADVVYASGGDRVTADNGNDTIIVSRTDAGNMTIDGGGNTDVISFNFTGNVTYDGAGVFTYVRNGETITVNTINVEQVDTNGTVAGGAFTLGAATTFGVVCFAEGTRIMTDLGEVPVEELRGGDLIATVSGEGSPMKPVLWTGRRHIRLAGHPDAAEHYPVRIAAGALGEGMPHRDLLVSPDHCMFLDGVLVPARLLVNGTTIKVDRSFAAVTYYHVELEAHDVLIAEGAPAESWLDTGNRSWFENAAVARLSVTEPLAAEGTGWDASRACAPLVHGGPRLAEIRAAIEARALAAEAEAPAPALVAAA